MELPTDEGRGVMTDPNAMIQDGQTTNGQTGNGIKPKPVCTFCKRRKIKCNREEPCSSCIRFDNPDCVYLEPEPKVNKKRNRIKKGNNNLEQELDYLKLKINDLERNVSNDTTNGSISNTRRVNGSLSTGYSGQGQFLFADPEDEFWDYNDTRDIRYDSNFAGVIRMIESKGIDDHFSLFDGQTPLVDFEPVRRRNFGILSWKSCINNDKCLQILFSHAMRSMTQRTRLYGAQTDFERKLAAKFEGVLLDNVQPFPSAADNAADKKDGSGPEPNEEYVFGEGSSNIFQPFKALNNPVHLMQGVQATRADYIRHEQVFLKQKIQNFLPARKVIWKLVDQFFTKLYASIPVIDEMDFRHNVRRLIGEDDLDEKCQDLKIVNKLDFAHLGILLLICRIAYLSVLPKTTGDINTTKIEDILALTDNEEHKLIIKHPINLDAVSLSQNCINLFNLFGPINMTIFQLVLVNRIYVSLAPESGDGPDHGEAQLFTSILFQLAYSLGIHREPNKTNPKKDERFKNLTRKMWYTLLVIDLTQTLQCGDPLNVNKYPFDTQLPTYSPGSSNLIDVEQEKHVVEGFQFLDHTYKPIALFVNQVLDVNHDFNVRQFCHHTQHVRFKLFNKLDDPSFLASYKQNLTTMDIVNVVRYKLELDMGHFICSIYFRLYNYFESRKEYDLSCFYLLRVVEKVLLILVPFYLDLATVDTAESSLLFVLIPGVEIMLHKGILFLCSIITRVKVQIMKMAKNPAHLLKMFADKEYSLKFNNLISLLKKLADVTNSLIAIPNSYSKRYYYSWIISRMAKHVMSLIKSESLSTEVCNSVVDFPVLDNLDNISKLLEVLDLCVDAKERLRHFSKESKNGCNNKKEEDGLKDPKGSDLTDVSSGTNSVGSGTNNVSSGTTSVSSGTTATSSVNSGSKSTYIEPNLYEYPNKAKKSNPRFDPTSFQNDIFNGSVDSEIDLAALNQLFSPDSEKSGEASSVGSSDQVDTLWLQLLSMQEGNLPQGSDDINFEIPQYNIQSQDTTGNPSTVSDIVNSPSLFNGPGLGEIVTESNNMPNKGTGTPNVSQSVIDEIFKQIT